MFPERPQILDWGFRDPLSQCSANFLCRAITPEHRQRFVKPVDRRLHEQLFRRGPAGANHPLDGSLVHYFPLRFAPGRMAGAMPETKQVPDQFAYGSVTQYTTHVAARSNLSEKTSVTTS